MEWMKMDWILALFQSGSRRALSAEIAQDSIAAFGPEAEQHLDGLRRERPTTLWYRALMWRAIREG